MKRAGEEYAKGEDEEKYLKALGGRKSRFMYSPSQIFSSLTSSLLKRTKKSLGKSNIYGELLKRTAFIKFESLRLTEERRMQEWRLMQKCKQLGTKNTETDFVGIRR